MRIFMSTLFMAILVGLTFSQQKANIGGHFGWSGPEAGDPWGELLVYPKSDSSFLFQLRTSNGDTSNVTNTIGLAIKKSENSYEFIDTSNTSICIIRLNYEGSYFNISTIDCQQTPLYGLTENFMRNSNDIPEYYLDKNSKVYFKDMTIE